MIEQLARCLSVEGGREFLVFELQQDFDKSYKAWCTFPVAQMALNAGDGFALRRLGAVDGGQAFHFQGVAHGGTDGVGFEVMDMLRA